MKIEENQNSSACTHGGNSRLVLRNERFSGFGWLRTRLKRHAHIARLSHKGFACHQNTNEEQKRIVFGVAKKTIKSERVNLLVNANTPRLLLLII